LTLFNDQKKDDYHWNKRQNKTSWGLYVSVGVICLILAWLLGTTGK